MIGTCAFGELLRLDCYFVAFHANACGWTKRNRVLAVEATMTRSRCYAPRKRRTKTDKRSRCVAVKPSGQTRASNARSDARRTTAAADRSALSSYLFQTLNSCALIPLVRKIGTKETRIFYVENPYGKKPWAPTGDDHYMRSDYKTQVITMRRPSPVRLTRGI